MHGTNTLDKGSANQVIKLYVEMESKACLMDDRRNYKLVTVPSNTYCVFDTQFAIFFY